MELPHNGRAQLYQEVIDYIEEKLLATWSPEQIARTPCELKLPSWRTIYRWIYEKYLVNGNLKVLRRKGKSHGVKETRGKYSKGKSIRKRDKSVYSRQEAGHWEADTVVSGQGKSKACFATLAERKTRFYIAVKMPDRRAETMENAIVAALSAFPAQLVKTITCDRGAEFANWRRIEQRLHCEVYFADPYCAWQKGTNENLNGLLREFYPKGRNLSRVAPVTLKRNLALINARPRKVLNFHSHRNYGTSNSIPVALRLTSHFDTIVSERSGGDGFLGSAFYTVPSGSERNPAADSASRYKCQSGCVFSIVAGTRLLTGFRSVSCTAAAFTPCGTTLTMVSASSICCTVMEIACRGTSATEGNQPSRTCCCLQRHPG